MNLSNRRVARLRDFAARTAILPAAYILTFCGPAVAGACGPPRLENTVKMEPLGNLGEVGVPITLNGVKKVLLFDTGGGTVNSVSSAVANELKLTPYRTGRSVDLRGDTSQGAVVVKNVVFGAVKASNARFQVMSKLPFDGVLSAGTMALHYLNMADVDLDIDFSAMTLNFFSSDHCEGDVVYWPHQALAVVPVTSVQGHIELPVTLDGHPLRAVIDTGAPWTVLNIARAEEKLGFSSEARVSQPSNIPKDNPAEQVFFRKYSALSFQGVTVTNPLVVVRPLQFGGKNDLIMLGSRAEHAYDNLNRLAPDIIIGMEILRHLHIYYATNEHKIYLTPAEAAK